ncbi:hypothetical protein LF41_719 [Lysobacter dokdonensis DS-58]|uniref:TonB C-terminal domain-containing protein n=1 Tax=Lysobacter dokdonensis DS-58 TaxID=1300345 RepID=A0A0A2WZJ3_9GAMM|nr:hypothetical protein [Lysobacter dokdonensis]KGQ18424.1 hypothetical protein LF41_719 [Lysobacter dokdonensis DS-58]
MQGITNALVALSLCCASFVAQAGNAPHIANEGSIGGEWKLAAGTRLAVPGYPESMKDIGDSVCIAMGYAIDKNGKTGGFTALKQWSGGGEKQTKDYWKPYSTAAAGAVSQWAFEPRAEIANPQRTITVATITFRGKDAMDAGQLAGHCRIEDLATTIKEAGMKANRDLVRRELERTARQAKANQSMVGNPAGALAAPSR